MCDKVNQSMIRAIFERKVGRNQALDRSAAAKLLFATLASCEGKCSQFADLQGSIRRNLQASPRAHVAVAAVVQ